MIAHIVKQSTGNALFLEELIRAAGQGDAESQPSTVVAMLQARIGRFDLGPRRVVQAASIFGLTFWRGGVMDMLGIDAKSPAAADVDQWLEVLVDAEIAKPNQDSQFGHEQQYGFRHALVREAAYSLLTESDLTTGHRLAARYLEHLGETEPLVLADHYRRGKELERSLALYIRAGDTASRLWALPEARAHYAAASVVLNELADDGEHRRGKVDLLLRQVRLGILADSFEQNLLRLTKARTLVDSLRQSDPAQSADDRQDMNVELLLGRVYYYQGRYDKAIDYYQRLYPRAEASGDPRLLSLLTQAMGSALVVQGRIADAVIWLSRAIALQEHLETDYERLRTLSSYACALVLAGRYAEGMALHDQALVQAAAGQRPSGLALAHMNRTLTLRWCGDFSALLPGAKETLAQATKSGDQLFIPGALTLIAWAHSLGGKPVEALSYLAHAHELAPGGRTMLGGWFLAGDAEMALRAGDSAQAIRVVAEHVPTFRSEGRLLALGLAEQVFGLALGYQDLAETAAADAHLSAALEVMETSGQRLGAAILRLEWAALCRHRGDESRTATLHAQAVAELTACGCAHLIETIERAAATTRNVP